MIKKPKKSVQSPIKGYRAIIITIFLAPLIVVYNSVIFEAITAVSMRSEIFLVVTPVAR
jgi:hypothetical protein